MTGKELYDRHLAEALPGTPLAAVFDRVGNGTASAEDLIAYARWEMWEAIYSLPPQSGSKEAASSNGEVSRVTDGFHAGCCISRAEAALRHLARLLEAVTG